LSLYCIDTEANEGKTMYTGMNSQAGNTLVQRIIDAARRMIAEQGAAHEEASIFACREIERLALAEGFEEADGSTVRLNAYYHIFKA